MAGRHHWDSGQNPAGDGSHYPEMMTVDDIGAKGLCRPLDIVGKNPFIGIKIHTGELTENGTLIRHDITHPRYRKVQTEAFKTNKIA